MLDEIQSVANWHATVKALWDADRRLGIPMHMVLVGSAPFLMQSDSTEGLTGRVEEILLAHWPFAEVSQAFNVTLNEYVYFGGFPGAIKLRADDQRWRRYVLDALIEPTLKHDTLALANAKKPAVLRELV